MTLDEFLEILSVGNPSITEKVVFLCKFQRGLDSSTLVDRFNFEVWSQLVEAFGTEDYPKWDLKKCPILIGLSRVKTNVSHSGFLDRDSISAVIDYLKYRKKITGKETQNKEPLFLNNFQNSIHKGWITDSFTRMRKNAGLDEVLNEIELSPSVSESLESIGDSLTEVPLMVENIIHETQDSVVIPDVKYPKLKLQKLKCLHLNLQNNQHCKNYDKLH